MKRRLLIVPLLFVLALPSCASSLKLKQQATATAQASETTLHDLRVSELAFYDSHLVASYNSAQHIAFLAALDKAQVAEADTARGLLAWNPKDTTTKPASALDYVKYAQAMVAIAQATGVTTGSFLANAQKILQQANDLLTFINGGKL